MFLKPEVNEFVGIFNTEELLFRHLHLVFFLTLAPESVPYTQAVCRGLACLLPAAQLDELYLALRFFIQDYYYGF